MSIEELKDSLPLEVEAAAPRRRGLRWPWAVLLSILLVFGGLATVGAAALARGVELPRPVLAQVEAALSGLRGGKALRVEQLRLVLENGALRLRAEGVRSAPLGSGAQPLRLDLALDALALLQGRIKPRSVEAVGGDLSIVLRRDGSAALAFGPMGVTPDWVLPPAPTDLSLSERGRRLLEAIAAGLRPDGAAAQLRRISLEGATLQLLDERGGGSWRAEDARLSLIRRGDSLDGALGATLRRGDAAAGLSLALRADAGLRSAELQAVVEDALLRAFLGEDNALGDLEAPVNLGLTALVDRREGVRTLRVEARAGAGALRLGPDRAPFAGGELIGAYALADDTLAIDRLKIEGESLSVEAAGKLRNVSRLLAAGAQEGAPFDIAMPRLTLVSSAFEAPVELRDLAMAGVLRPAARSIDVQTFTVAVGAASAQFAGRFYWGEDGAGSVRPGLEAEGTVTGLLTPRDVLALWPLQIGASARSWFAEAMLQAQISAASLAFAITPQDLADGRLENEALRIDFPVEGATVAILEGMDPLTDGRGTVALRGHSLTVDVQKAAIGAIAIEKGAVSIEDLSSQGFAVIEAHGVGGAKDVIGLILQTPLEVQDRLPFEPESLVGQGALDLRLRRPLRGGITAEEVPFQVTGRFEGVGAVAKSGRLSVSDWLLSLEGDETGLRLSGPLRFGRSQVELDWYERFGDLPSPRSRYQVRGRLLAQDLDLLGVPARGVAQGAMSVLARAEGDGLQFARASVELDLAETELRLPEEVWTKRAGAPARARLSAVRDEDGSLRFYDAHLEGPGLSGEGEAALGPDGRLLRLAAKRLRIGDRYDVALSAGRGAGALLLEAKGAAFDATPFLPRQGAPEPGRVQKGKGAGLEIRVEADRLLLREGVELRGADVRIYNEGSRLDRLRIEGLDPAGGAVFVSMEPADASLRRLQLRAEDVGFALRGIVGENPLRGGRGQATGHWDVAKQRGRIDLTVDAFKIADLPLAARLFSSVASLRALSDLVNGEGVAFDRLEASFLVDPSRIELTSGQAIGASVGVTASGGYAFQDQRIEADGVLIPAYRLNSVLGDVPGIGRLFTSRRGEGVVGFTYSVRGSAERARVAVNPFSGLAPGILRRMFEPGPALAERGSKPAAGSAP